MNKVQKQISQLNRKSYIPMNEKEANTKTGKL